MRSNAAEPRPQYKILGRFQCREALQSLPPFLTYQARAQGLAGFERVFAVKVLPADASPTRPDAGQRLIESAIRANTVKDARVGQVVDSGTAPDGSAYVATEFVFGLNLSGLRGGALVEASGKRTATTMLVAHLAAEIAGALAAAHEMRPAVVHGGLSPSNAFLTVRGAVKVIDFGQRMAVMPGRLAGTKRSLSPYAAPELLLAGEGSPEADVFALGSMVFEIATGKTPPSARNPRSATDLARALSVVSPDLEDVIASLLRVDPSKRPSARAAEGAFRKIAAGLSEPELRAHLAALARQLSTPQGPPPSSAQSMVMPQIELQSEQPAPPSERHTARTARPAAPDPVRQDPPENLDLPQNTLPFADLIASGLAGAVPQGGSQAGQTAEVLAFPSDLAMSADPGLGTEDHDGHVAAALPLEPSSMLELLPDDPEATSPGGVATQAVAQSLVAGPPPPPPQLHIATTGNLHGRPKPNMENITTKEMDAMFAPGISDVADPGATLQAPSLSELQGDDGLDEAQTKSFSRGMFAKLVGNDAETPVRQPIWNANDDAPSGFASSEAEGTNEVDDAQLVTSGVHAATAHTEDAAEVPAYALVPTALVPTAVEPPVQTEAEAASEVAPATESSPTDAPESDAGRASEHMPALLSQDDALDLEGKVASKRRLYVTLATAAVVALAAGLAGGMLLGDPKGAVSERLAPLPAGQQSDLQKAVAARAKDDEKRDVLDTTPPVLPTDSPAANAIEPKAALVNRRSPAPTAANVFGEGGPAPRDVEGRVRLTFKTQPTGAVVWINGGERGRAPVRAELKERHKALVIIKAGFKRVEEEMDHASLTAERTYTLVPVAPPSEGTALIRVECEQEGKYPISIDGTETGLLCPAEVRVTPGLHSVEVFVPWRFKLYANQVSVSARKIKITKFNK